MENGTTKISICPLSGIRFGSEIVISSVGSQEFYRPIISIPFPPLKNDDNTPRDDEKDFPNRSGENV